jgi:hypothetical protein
MRGLYAHASWRMRDDLTAALQARWEESLSARAALNPRSPVPLLDDLLAHRFLGQAAEAAPVPQATMRQGLAPGDREKMISQIPPKPGARTTQAGRLEPVLRAADLARYRFRSGGANETRTRDPLLAKTLSLAA